MQHFDQNAEENIIFALGTSPEHVSRIFKTLRDEDFFDNTCANRFKKYHKAYNIGQYPEFAKSHISKLEMPKEPMKLWDAVSIVLNHALRRKIELAVSSVAERCRDYSSPITGLQSALKETLLEAIDTRACKSPSNTKDDLVQVIDQMQNCKPAFYTGLSSVDKCAPIQPTDFVMLCARPGVGKSALSSTMILENFLGKNKRKGIFFCIEMDVRQNYARLSSQMCRVPLSKYINSQNNPPTKAELATMMDTFGQMGENFPDQWFVQGAVSIDEIEEMVEIHKPDWIMIDYVQLVQGKGDGWEKFANISQRLRMLALDKHIAVIAVAQLNRDANGATPSMSQIKNSGQFEQDATHIFLLDRPESERLQVQSKRGYVDKRNNPFNLTIENGFTNNAVLVCAKNRNGAPFYSCLDFHPESTSFTEYE